MTHSHKITVLYLQVLAQQNSNTTQNDCYSTEFEQQFT